MSYLVLARKSRPQSFAEVVGQKAVVKTLQNSIARERIAHAILFSGVRGVGKTTLARLMAKAINCQAAPAQRPCNTCQPCQDIAAGRALDLVEIDGASNRGIQEIRELKENIKFMPAHSAYKVIIIDEVHMLTTEAFNALLKTLEEPPAHVYFMFATTEIHKIPITILSRCQQYELKKISAAELGAHFRNLAEAEGVTIDPAALALIVREAAGSIRDGLSLLDQMFSFGEENISLADVVEVLGLINHQSIMALTRALLQGEKKQVFSCLEEVFAQGANLKRFVEDLLDNFRNLLLCSIRGGTELVDIADEELANLQEIAATCTPETVHLKLSLLMEAAEALQYAPQPRLTLEISLLKIIEASNVTPLSALLGQLGTILPQLQELDNIQAATVKTERAIPAAPAPEIPPSLEKTEKKTLPKEPGEKSEPPAPHPVSSVPVITHDTVAEQPSPTEPPEETVLAGDELQHRWSDFIDFLEKDTIWLGSTVRGAEKHELEISDVSATLHLHFSDRENSNLLAQPENLQRLTRLALDFFGKNLTVELHRPEKNEETDKNSPRVRRNELARNPLVRMTEEVFHGQVAAIRLSSLQPNSDKKGK